MDPQALEVISSTAIYIGGVLILAAMAEGLRALIWGVVFYVVLRLALKKYRR